MQALAEFIVKVADLAEAEGRSARSAVRGEAREFRTEAARFVTGLAVACAATVLIVAGTVLCGYALYLALRQVMSEAGAVLVTGIVCAGCGAGALWVFRMRTA